MKQYKTIPIILRLFDKVKITKDCWIWTGCKKKTGYGKIGDRGKTKLVHRVSYEYFNGPISYGLVIDHLCKTPSCVRPDHLELVSQKENVRRGKGKRKIGKKGEAWCSSCKEFLSTNLFTLNKSRWNGFEKYCTPCRKEKYSAGS